MSVSNPRRPWICFIRVQKAPQMNLVSCVCVFFSRVLVRRRRCSRSQPPSSASLFGEDFVCAGRRSMNASAEVLPSPPQFSGETGTTSFRKKKKKVPGVSSAMELLCPPRVVQWGAEISEGGESLVSVSSCVLYVLFADFLGLNVSVCILGRLPRPGPFVNNLCGIVLCYLGRTQRAKHSKECV